MDQQDLKIILSTFTFQISVNPKRHARTDTQIWVLHTAFLDWRESAYKTPDSIDVLLESNRKIYSPNSALEFFFF
jgi:hypothetical protein